jgi:hypothetical protein
MDEGDAEGGGDTQLGFALKSRDRWYGQSTVVLNLWDRRLDAGRARASVGEGGGGGQREREIHGEQAKELGGNEVEKERGRRSGRGRGQGGRKAEQDREVETGRRVAMIKSHLD